jgi:hypothetical protein
VYEWWDFASAWDVPDFAGAGDVGETGSTEKPAGAGDTQNATAAGNAQNAAVAGDALAAEGTGDTPNIPGDNTEDAGRQTMQNTAHTPAGCPSSCKKQGDVRWTRGSFGMCLG